MNLSISHDAPFFQLKKTRAQHQLVNDFLKGNLSYGAETRCGTEERVNGRIVMGKS
jgi:hypothetical protein